MAQKNGHHNDIFVIDFVPYLHEHISNPTSYSMKFISFKGCIIAFLLLVAIHDLHAQDIRTGDVVYFSMIHLDRDYYFRGPLYVIATVKSVIGSQAVLDTEMYLCKTSEESEIWYTSTTLKIERWGVTSWKTSKYVTWRAEENRGYRYPVGGLRRYTSAVEKEITGGSLRHLSYPLEMGALRIGR